MDFNDNQMIVNTSSDINHNEQQMILNGYKVPSLYVDCTKQKKDRDQAEFLEQVWKRKKSYPKQPEKLDKKGNVILPNRDNYFEILTKSHDFGYSSEKEENLKKLHSSHGRNYPSPRNVIEKVDIIKEKEKAKLYKADRETVFDDMIYEEKKNQNIYPHMVNIVTKIKEELIKEKSENLKNLSEKIKEKYKNNGSLAYEYKDILIIIFFFYNLLILNNLEKI